MNISPMLIILTLVFAEPAFACADGPDTFRVVDVTSNDVLNVRSGPALGFSIIGELPYNAVGVKNIDSVPVNTCDGEANLNRYERSNFWTKISWKKSDNFVFGWVKSMYLSE